ncbi:hypothetical protein BU26DRAFT_567320 [Trematosphaeria pertusa]|uniref:Uncharacterized protein n=1 Tax=Trematosphaeria pertusa TaxID=390896 RepID=A0A6A6I617_9PLEO|nr:uncharacterized protein BU26DRAFT_567320 [Trematosphaeria pertusa]KAF2245801.1 hypothetical protein BU26DRAFT_567320 [Trematosphaeria pertusa]
MSLPEIVLNKLPGSDLHITGRHRVARFVKADVNELCNSGVPTNARMLWRSQPPFHFFGLSRDPSYEYLLFDACAWASTYLMDTLEQDLRDPGGRMHFLTRLDALDTLWGEEWPRRLSEDRLTMLLLDNLMTEDRLRFWNDANLTIEQGLMNLQCLSFHRRFEFYRCRMHDESIHGFHVSIWGSKAFLTIPDNWDPTAVFLDLVRKATRQISFIFSHYSKFAQGPNHRKCPVCQHSIGRARPKKRFSSSQPPTGRAKKRIQVGDQGFCAPCFAGWIFSCQGKPGPCPRCRWKPPRKWKGRLLLGDAMAVEQWSQLEKYGRLFHRIAAVGKSLEWFCREVELQELFELDMIFRGEQNPLEVLHNDSENPLELLYEASKDARITGQTHGTGESQRDPVRRRKKVEAVKVGGARRAGGKRRR